MKPSETCALSLEQTRFSVRDLAYAAGILDGEGCIGAWGGSEPFVYIKVTNTDKRLLDWFQAKFGGYVRIKDRKISNPKWAVAWDWYLTRPDTIPFLKKMIPFIKLKQDQLHLAMAIKACIDKHSKPERISKMCQKLKALKRARKIQSK